MILFCDTSALVKLYVREDSSETVADRAQASDCVAVCRIAWVETMSALARRGREQVRDRDELELARKRFETDWPSYLKIEVTQELVELAGDHADTFALRAYDSMQLAALQTVHFELPREVSFACFDARLMKAARVLGIAAI